MIQQPNVYREIARSYHNDRLNGSASRRQLRRSRTAPERERGRTRPLSLSLAFSGATLAALIIALVR